MRLKSVVDYVTEVLSHTVKERCMKGAVAEACKAAADKLHVKAGQHVALARESSAALTADTLRSQLQLAASQLLSDASTKVGLCNVEALMCHGSPVLHLCACHRVSCTEVCECSRSFMEWQDPSLGSRLFNLLTLFKLLLCRPWRLLVRGPWVKQRLQQRKP